MIKEKRKFKRIQIKLDIELSLYDADKGEGLTAPSSGIMYNISREGAVLELPAVINQGKHLFFAPLESDSVTFRLTVYHSRDNQAENIELLAKPVWFNRNQDEESRSFLIGVEFQDRLSRETINRLICV